MNEPKTKGAWVPAQAELRQLTLGQDRAGEIRRYFYRGRGGLVIRSKAGKLQAGLAYFVAIDGRLRFDGKRIRRVATVYPWDPATPLVPEEFIDLEYLLRPLTMAEAVRALRHKPNWQSRHALRRPVMRGAPPQRPDSLRQVPGTCVYNGTRSGRPFPLGGGVPLDEAAEAFDRADAADPADWHRRADWEVCPAIR